MDDTAFGIQAEQKPAGNEGPFDTAPFGDEIALGSDENNLGQIAAGLGDETFNAVFVGLFEIAGKPFEQFGSFGPGPGGCFRQIEKGVATAVVSLFPPIFTRGEKPASRLVQDRDPVVGGTAMPAEHQRKQRLVGFARLGPEFRHFEVPDVFGFERGPDGIAAGEELVQAEGEDGELAGWAAKQVCPVQQEALDDVGTAEFVIGAG